MLQIANAPAKQTPVIAKFAPAPAFALHQWVPSHLDFRSMRSLGSQARSQKRLLESQSVRPPSGTHSSQDTPSASSGPREPPPPEEVDVIQRMTLDQVVRVVQNPPRFHVGDFQAKLVVLTADRKPISQEQWKAMDSANTVLLHIYNLSQSFVGPNSVLAFSEGGAVGGAFHVGIEVYGSEFSYGVYGLCCDLPRSETCHVYQCSVPLGRTEFSQMRVADALHNMSQVWLGRGYDLFGRNCCSFAAEFARVLGVGEVPRWVDRLPRVLHASREAGRKAIQFSDEVGRTAGMLAIQHGFEASRVVQRIATHEIPAMVRVARPHVDHATQQAVIHVKAAAVVTSAAVGQASVVVGRQIQSASEVGVDLAYKGAEVSRVLAYRGAEASKVLATQGAEVSRQLTLQGIEVSRDLAYRGAEVSKDLACKSAQITKELSYRGAVAGQELYDAVRPHVQHAARTAWQATSNGLIQMREQIADRFGDESPCSSADPSPTRNSLKELPFGECSSIVNGGTASFGQPPPSRSFSIGGPQTSVSSLLMPVTPTGVTPRYVTATPAPLPCRPVGYSSHLPVATSIQPHRVMHQSLRS
eukprot:TRINITY_DN48214_c0_g1_i1.p1 TRINITY_DN48214_c0_g1~~TRINITY_DN48214_c0_g1_i1.p1  ORF type:complete len:585 (+),score=48.93 TRINITY_DN48214_c0_g1_i1:112-1866(+)